jgi:hypothetical protein
MKYYFSSPSLIPFSEVSKLFASPYSGTQPVLELILQLFIEASVSFRGKSYVPLPPILNIFV